MDKEPWDGEFVASGFCSVCGQIAVLTTQRAYHPAVHFNGKCDASLPIEGIDMFSHDFPMDKFVKP